MKRFIIALSAAALISTAGLAVAEVATAAPPPIIDNANARINVQPSKFVATACPGGDAANYVNQPANYITYRGSWKGVENEGGGPLGLTNYNLTGPFTVAKIVWTINLNTGRGVLTGTATLKSVPATGAAAVKTYSGPIRLITQGLPDSAAGNAVPARGWIDASTFTANVADGSTLLANVEFEILPGFAAIGQYGDANASLNIPDYSVVTNNQAC